MDFTHTHTHTHTHTIFFQTLGNILSGKIFIPLQHPILLLLAIYMLPEETHIISSTTLQRFKRKRKATGENQWHFTRWNAPGSLCRRDSPSNPHHPQGTRAAPSALMTRSGDAQLTPSTSFQSLHGVPSGSPNTNSWLCSHGSVLLNSLIYWLT